LLLASLDCGGHGLNIALSLLDIGDCELAEIESTETYIQLLQLSDYDKTRIQQRKMEIDRTIFYCGMHSHIFAIQNGRRVYLQILEHRLPKRLHETSILFLEESAIISGALPNSTITSSINHAESTIMDGCSSGNGSSNRNEYDTIDGCVL